MLQWTYEYSKGSRILDEVHVATDHEDIASFCRNGEHSVLHDVARSQELLRTFQ